MTGKSSLKFLKDFEKNSENISENIENLALPRCFHIHFRIALYNLFMHSPLANQKQDILLSV